MKQKTITQLATCHNRLARLNNLIGKIDDDFSEVETKKLKKLQEQTLNLLLDFSEFKTKAFEKRNLDIPIVK